jgi:hypothetical protein
VGGEPEKEGSGCGHEQDRDLIGRFRCQEQAKRDQSDFEEMVAKVDGSCGVSGHEKKIVASGGPVLEEELPGKDTVIEVPAVVVVKKRNTGDHCCRAPEQ